VKKRNNFWVGVSVIMILAITLVSACTPTPTPTPSTTAPGVISTNPGNVQNVPVTSPITATFNEAIDPSTITTETFTLKKGTTPVSGKVTYAGTTATFIPATGLELCTSYTAAITTGVKNLTGKALARDYVWNFYTSCAGSGPGVGGAASTQAGGSVGSYGGSVNSAGGGVPAYNTMVISTSPADYAQCVPVYSPITATFSGVITNATFTVRWGNIPVAGTVTYSGVTATFTPLTSLPASGVFTATVTSGAANKVWTFTTCAAPDITPPTVLFTVPVGPCLLINSVITATFSEPMNPSTVLSAFTLMQGATPVAGTVTYVGLTAIFTPTTLPLTPLTSYTATISTAAEDLAGNHLAIPRTWPILTCAGPDITPPTVTPAFPTAGATCVALDTNITATFSEPMNPLTINTTTFTVMNGVTPVTGTVTYAGVTATFNPDVINLAFPATYTVTITTGVTDLAGIHLVAPLVWTFTTCGPAGPAPVLVLSNCPVSILAGSTITNTGITTVNGDVDLSPGTAVVGFPPGVVNLPGVQHVNDGVAALAQVDLTTAYGDAAGRTPTVTYGPGADIGGLTLTPGVYKSPSSLFITTGNLTLDAQGNANAVFIFQMVSTLITAPGNQIILVNNAQPNKIFWQVGSSATLGTNSVFNGTIMANQSIGLNTGARLNGRALARIGAVTLDSNIVTTTCP
jgi:hypothetical protein